MTGGTLIDLRHLGQERILGSYLIETEDGPALVDCGAATTIGALHEGLAAAGTALADVRHLLLTHVHLDHAGAAGHLVREHPGLRVHVSAVGLPHLADPSRLERSARRLYAEAFDELWGALLPVPPANLVEAGTEAAGLAAFPTPGHASHHVSYLARDGTLYAGDVAGVRIAPARFVLPPTPPPDVDVEAWHASLDEIERRAPKRLALIHFGVFDDVAEHVGRLRRTLDRWSALVGAGADERAFTEAARADFRREGVADGHVFSAPAPLWQCYAGLRRYWDRRAEAGIAGAS